MTPDPGTTCVLGSCFTSPDVAVLFSLLGGLLEITGFAVAWLRLRAVWHRRWPGESLLPSSSPRQHGATGRVEARSGMKGHGTRPPDPGASVAEQLEAVRQQLLEYRREFDSELSKMKSDFDRRVAALSSAENARWQEAEEDVKRDTRFALTLAATLAGGGVLLQFLSVLAGALQTAS